MQSYTGSKGAGPSIVPNKGAYKPSEKKPAGIDPQFSNLGDIKPTRGGRNTPDQPKVGYHRAD
jgi:hypothetical protein